MIPYMLDSTSFDCPYCGSENTLTLEPAHEDQEWIEDCSTCCQPILFILSKEGSQWTLITERP